MFPKANLCFFFSDLHPTSHGQKRKDQTIYSWNIPKIMTSHPFYMATQKIRTLQITRIMYTLLMCNLNTLDTMSVWDRTQLERVRPPGLDLMWKVRLIKILFLTKTVPMVWLVASSLGRFLGIGVIRKII